MWKVWITICGRDDISSSAEKISFIGEDDLFSSAEMTSFTSRDNLSSTTIKMTSFVGGDDLYLMVEMTFFVGGDNLFSSIEKNSLIDIDDLSLTVNMTFFVRGDVCLLLCQHFKLVHWFNAYLSQVFFMNFFLLSTDMAQNSTFFSMKWHFPSAWNGIFPIKEHILLFTAFKYCSNTIQNISEYGEIIHENHNVVFCHITHLKVADAIQSSNDILLKEKVLRDRWKWFSPGPLGKFQYDSIHNSHLKSNKILVMSFFQEPGLIMVKKNEPSLLPNSTSYSLYTYANL